MDRLGQDRIRHLLIRLDRLEFLRLDLATRKPLSSVCEFVQPVSMKFGQPVRNKRLSQLGSDVTAVVIDIMRYDFRSDECVPITTLSHEINYININRNQPRDAMVHFHRIKFTRHALSNLRHTGYYN